MTDSTAESLDSLVDAFEDALNRDGHADLTDFLPAPDHPYRLLILLELVRVDLEWCWSHETPVPLEQYRHRFPELFADDAARHAVTFEEFRLRRQAGQDPSPEEYEQRYGIDASQWPRPSAPSSALVAQAAEAYREFSQVPVTRRRDIDAWCRSFRGDANAAQYFRELHQTNPVSARRIAEGIVAMPEAGGEFLGFRLESELGRGAFGRVFLARQGELADRRVALKVTPEIGGESQTLAQMQHTHIVPVYSVHRTGTLQAICMPYFGRTTLADVLHDLSQRPTLPRSGADLLSSVSRRPDSTLIDAGTTVQIPEVDLTAVTLRKLEGRSYAEAVLWLGACLADGLAHAHERGILHRDLKPANVLLTDEGQPMLLDFNLSEDVKLRGTATAAAVGGTLPYMSPEQLEAFGGQRRVLDARSDVYALGIILYELLAGRAPFPRVANGTPMPAHELIEKMLEKRRQTPPPVRRWNRSVTPAAGAILLRCLHPDPACRYQNARQLQEDLERQLEHRPLRFTPEPSLRERVKKWVRSNPRLLGRFAAVAAVVAVATALGLGVWGWTEARVSAARVGVEAFRDDFHAVRDVLNARGTDPAEADGAVQRGREALARYGVVENVNWSERPELRLLPSAERERLRREAGELLLLLADASARPRSARPEQSAGNEEALDEARRLNELAEACFPEGDAPPALWLQRAELLQRRMRLETGPSRQELEAAEADARRKAQAAKPRTAQECYELAREHAASGRHREALPLLEEAVRLDPRHYWAHFQLGLCRYELNDNARALTSFSVCIALDPKLSEAYFNRGLAAQRQLDYKQAKADFDEVIRLKPDQAEAYANRALVLQAMRQPGDALADLDQALRLSETTRNYFLRARARELVGDADGAKKDREEGMRREPTDEPSWVARGNARLRTDAEGALADFDRALAINPRSRSALMGKADVLAERLGRTESSIAVLDRVIELYPDHAPAWSGRGVLNARRKDRDAALRDAAEAVKRSPTPLVRYQVACIHALTARTPEEKVAAVRLVMEAMRLGFGGDLLARDTDLDPIRSLPEFKRLEEIVALQAAASR